MKILMEYFRNNTLGTASVVNCAIKAGVKKIIFFSSAAVKAKPSTPYAVSKINAKKFINLEKGIDGLLNLEHEG